MDSKIIVRFILITSICFAISSANSLLAADANLAGNRILETRKIERFPMRDTIPHAPQRISPPWDKMVLAYDKMKPSFPFNIERVKNFPWLPVSLGAVGGGVAIILLTGSDDGNGTPCELSPVAEIIASTCGRTDGAILLTVPGETDIRFSWSNGSTSDQITQLLPGNYSVTLTRDGNECRTVKEYTVPDEELAFNTTLEVSDSECGKNNGMIRSETMPAGSYTYLWSNGATSESISELSPGSYTLTVSLGATCEKVFQSEVEEEAPSLNVGYTVVGGNCKGGGDIVLEISNATGTGIIIVQLNGPDGTSEFELMSGSHSLGDLTNLPSGDYTVTLYEKEQGAGCSIILEIEVPDETPEILAVDDKYQTPFETILEENILQNDSGLEISVIDALDIIGGELTWADNGEIAFKPDDGFSGDGSFRYIIQDGCDSTAEALVTIEVLPKDCDFTITSDAQNASCGFNDGIVTVTVNEPGNYSYEWENGEMGPTLSNLTSGTYTIFIEETDLGCILDFEITIEEDPAVYYRNLFVQPPLCDIPGDITFEVVSPGSGPVSMEVFHPNGDEVFIISPGIVFLSDYVSMIGGQYKVILIDESIGMQCSHDFTVDLPPVQVIEIALETIIPPSSPTSMDGIIFGVVVDPGEEPYQIFLNGQFRGIFSGSQFVIEGLGAGEYTIWITDRNGCTSNEVNALLIIVMDPSFAGIRRNWSGSTSNIDPEHPETYNPSSMPDLELFFAKPLPISSMSMEIAIGLTGKELSLRTDLCWQKQVIGISNWNLKAKAAGGIRWSVSNQLDPFIQMGPSLQKYFYPGVLIDLDVPLSRIEGKWNINPAFSIQIPLIEKPRN